MQVFVRHNNVDSALRLLKRRLVSSGTIQEHKRRKFFEKKSEKRKREKVEARREIRRSQRKVYIRLFS